MSNSPETNHLSPKEIRYLALEGGGGKGFAYLGAIEVLERRDVDVMSQIRGVSGTSAGAITALMLSMGMTAKEIAHELEANDFNTFFDRALEGNVHRLIPSPFQYVPRTNNTYEKLALVWLRSVQGGFNELARIVLARLLKKHIPAPLTTLLRDLPEFLTYYHRDMGFFSGKAARDYFDGLIQKRMRLKTGERDPTKFANLSFANHQKHFECDLLVAGANLSTGKTVLFSAYHTPYFPVADAVRISMSLPGIYKPYVIQSSTLPKWPACGTYVDGGIWNNIPFREIGSLGKTEQKLIRSKSAATIPERQPKTQPIENRSIETVVNERQTLGLRLEIVPPEKILTGGTLLRKFLTGFAPGESQVIAELEPFMIVLDTTGLDLLTFNPDDETKREVRKRSRRATYKYFCRDVPKEDEDPADDERVAEAKARSVCD